MNRKLDTLLTQKSILEALRQDVRCFVAPPPPSTKTKKNGLNALQEKLRMLFRVRFPYLAEESALDDLYFACYPNLRRTVFRVLSLDAVDDVILDEVLIELEKAPWDWRAEQSDPQFDSLNAQYQYFTRHNPSLKLLFQELAIVCRTSVFVFERHPAVSDDDIYLCAYKMMALFIPDQIHTPHAQELYGQLNAFLANVKQTDQPITHVFLKLTLPVAAMLKDRVGWRMLFKKAHEKALLFFNQAIPIEKKLLDKAPQDLNEAIATAALLKYERGHEDPMLAALCYGCELRGSRGDTRDMEKVFNQCLDYIHSSEPHWPKKVSDHLPDLMLQGEGMVRDYCFAKLPINDKRGLVLGKFTDCCQLIGGVVDAYVKNAMSLQDHGLYVILKHKRGAFLPTHTDGSLNYTNFQIIGTTYAWMSSSDDLCLDSLECLRDSISHLQLRHLVSQFASTVLERYPSIQKIHVGASGRTPAELFPHTQITLKMKTRGRIPYEHNVYYVFNEMQGQYVVAQSPELTFIDAPDLLRLWQAHQASHSTSKSLIAFLRTLSLPELRAALEARDKNGRTLLCAAAVGIIACDVCELLSLYPDDGARLAALRMKDAYDSPIVFFLAEHHPDTCLAVLANIVACSKEEFLDMIDIQDRDHRTVFHLAVHHPDLLSALLVTTIACSQEKLLDILFKRDDFGQTVFHRAAEYPRSLSVLLDAAGAYPEEQSVAILQLQDRDGYTVFHLAVKYPRSLSLLLTAITACPVNKLLEILHMQNSDGQTIFHLTVRKPKSWLLFEASDIHLMLLSTILAICPNDDARVEALQIPDRNGCTVWDVAQDKPALLSVILASVTAYSIDHAKEGIKVC